MDFLDGLDEVTSNQEDHTLQFRNFIAKYSKNRFVMSCRIAAYNQLFEHLVDIANG